MALLVPAELQEQVALPGLADHLEQVDHREQVDHPEQVVHLEQVEPVA